MIFREKGLDERLIDRLKRELEVAKEDLATANGRMERIRLKSQKRRNGTNPSSYHSHSIKIHGRSNVNDTDLEQIGTDSGGQTKDEKKRKRTLCADY